MTMTIGISQMNSKDDKEENLAAAEKSIRELAGKGAQLIMLPEHFNFIGPEPLRKENAEPLDQSPSLDRIRTLAAQLKVAVHIGSYMEREGSRFFNTGVVFDHHGERIARYRKIHLFDVEIPDGKNYRESDTISPGNEVVTFSLGAFMFGMATCYDLRFPELFRRLADMGADVILLPAAFTLQTGRDHWELLLRARAVENLCWVAAAGQWGNAPPDHTTFGRSMVVNPWGLVVSQAPDGVSTITAGLDLEIIRAIRTKFPANDHIRRDLFF
ncbi:MAG: carbon-nitrogen hydrolase family protein [Desulforhopalus sp.]